MRPRINGIYNEREEQPGRLDELDGTPSEREERRGIMLVISFEIRNFQTEKNAK